MSVSRSLPADWMVCGELHLFVGEVALRVVAEQLGQDQQRIERRAQLVRHVGEEVGLVAAGLLQLPRLQLHAAPASTTRSSRWASSSCACSSSWHVGLLQLDLLLLEADLRFLERPALLLQLLVGDPKLLALDLQLLGLALRLGEQGLKVFAIERRSHGHADRLGNFREQIEHQRIERMQKTQLQDGIDRALGRGRQDEKLAGPAPAKPRADGQVTVRHVIDANDFALDGRLPEQPIPGFESFRNRAVIRHTDRGNAPKVRILPDKKSARVCVHVVRQKAEHALPELREGLVAKHRCREPELPILEPFLPFPRRGRALNKQGHHAGEHEAQEPGQNAIHHRGTIGNSYLRDPLLAQPRLHLVHRPELRADDIHLALAPIRHHLRLRLLKASSPAQGDRLFQLGNLCRDTRLEHRKLRLLLRIIPRQIAGIRDFGVDAGLCDIERFEISFVARDEITALPRLRVFHQAEDLIEPGNHRRVREVSRALSRTIPALRTPQTRTPERRSAPPPPRAQLVDGRRVSAEGQEKGE